MNDLVGNELREALSNSNHVSGSTKNEHVGAAVAAGDLVDDWINKLEPDEWVMTNEAKRDYFLTTGDLATLVHDTYGGASKCYMHEDLVNESLSKHGRDVVLKKLQARHKREENKRMRKEKAEKARKRLKTITNTTSDGGTSATSAVMKANAGDTQEIKKLRKGLLKIAKMNLGFETSGAPKKWRVYVPGTSKATFAALMGRPTDVDLDSFVKNGAYYTGSYEASKLFGTCEAQLTKDFKREGVVQKIGSSVTVSYKPSTMGLSIKGYATMQSSNPWHAFDVACSNIMRGFGL